MNSLPKLIASIAALIASLSFAWIALTATETIPHHGLQIYHGGRVQLTTHPPYGSSLDVGEHDGFDIEVTTGIGGFEITH